MSLVALLLMLISLLPIILAAGLWRLFPYSRISIALLLFLFSIALWQMSISILYMGDFFSPQTLELLFKFLRIGPIMTIPALFFIAYTCAKQDQPANSSRRYKYSDIFRSKAVLWGIVGWSAIVYVINWTSYDVKNLSLHTMTSEHGEISFYFPEYGELAIFFKIHSFSFLLLSIGVYFLANHLYHVHVRSFMKQFSKSTIILFITGTSNFLPETGVLLSSFGIILFSVFIIFSFLKMQYSIMNDYQQVIDKQQRLDYMGTLTSSLIHELKNSLTMLKGYSKLIHRTQRFDKKGQEWLHLIHLGHDQLNNLVNSYSSFLQKQVIQMRECEIHNVIDMALQLTKHDLEENNFEVEFHKKENIYCYLNNTYMHQVFVNLIKNSIEATSSEQADRKLQIMTSHINDMIIIDYMDCGSGIPRHKWNEVFTPFISSKEHGMGIGLSFCKKVLFEHRGNIEILASSKNGTHFRITLPKSLNRI